jgi:hypothetical protein
MMQRPRSARAWIVMQTLALVILERKVSAEFSAISVCGKRPLSLKHLSMSQAMISET